MKLIHNAVFARTDFVQIWACKRFPRMCPHRLDDHTAGQQPLVIGGYISPVDYGELGMTDFSLTPLRMCNY